MDNHVLKIFAFVSVLKVGDGKPWVKYCCLASEDCELGVDNHVLKIFALESAIRISNH